MSKREGARQPDAQSFKTNSLFASTGGLETDEPDDVEDGDRSLSETEIYGLLKSPRRRFVLWYLAEFEGTVAMGELAEQIAAWENEKDVDAVDSSERKRAYVALYQVHLPKLDEAAVLEFDRNRKEVRRGENYELVERVTLAGDDGTTDAASFAPYYLALAAASVLAVGAARLVFGTSETASTLAVFAVVASFAALATADLLRSSDDLPEALLSKLEGAR